MVFTVTAHPSMRAAADALPQGAYTTFRTYGRDAVVRLEAHFARLEESAALMGMPGPLDRAAARSALRVALGGAGHDQSRVRLTFAPPQVHVSVEPFAPYPAAVFEAGVRCVTVPLRRDNPHAKSTAFNVQAAAAYRQLPAGVEEGLMHDETGEILEGMSSNFFAVLSAEDGGLPRLRFEQARVLTGTTSLLVKELAQGLLVLEPRAVKLAELGRVREAFITSVSREVMPIRQINDHTLGAPGPLTRELMRRLAALVAREAVSVQN